MKYQINDRRKPAMKNHRLNPAGHVIVTPELELLETRTLFYCL